MKKRWQTVDRAHMVEVCIVEGGGYLVVWSRPDALDARAYRSPAEADKAADRVMDWISDRDGVQWSHMTVS